MKKLTLTIVLIWITSTVIMKDVDADNVTSFLSDCNSSFLTESYKEESERIRKSLLIRSVIEVESANNPLAFNASELAAGVLQIRPIMVKEVNRLVGHNKYKNEDRWDKDKSIKMFIDYQNAVNPEWDEELAARRWNGGHFGQFKEATLIYWHKVMSKMNKLKESDNIITFSINNEIYYTNT